VTRLVEALDRRPVRWAIALLAVGLLLAGVIALGNREATRTVMGPTGRSASPAEEPISDRAKYGSVITLPISALGVSRDFIRAAVLRTDMPRAWDISAPALKAGYTRRQWLTGTIPVVPFPARAFSRAAFKTVRSRQRDILLLVYVTSKHEALVRSQDFMLELVPVHHHWLVSYWAPRGHIGALPAIP
jgi:hypothetical protein